MSYVIEQRGNGVVTHKNIDPDKMVFEGGVEIFDDPDLFASALEK